MIIFKIMAFRGLWNSLCFIKLYYFATIFISIDIFSKDTMMENTNIRELYQIQSTSTPKQFLIKFNRVSKIKGFIRTRKRPVFNWLFAKRLTQSAINCLSYATKAPDIDVDIGAISRLIPREQARSGWASTILKFVIKFANSYCPLGSVHVVACLVRSQRAYGGFCARRSLISSLTLRSPGITHIARVATSPRARIDDYLTGESPSINHCCSIARAVIKVSPTFQERTRRNFNIHYKTEYWEKDKRYYFKYISRNIIKYQASFYNDD